MQRPGLLAREWAAGAIFACAVITALGCSEDGDGPTGPLPAPRPLCVEPPSGVVSWWPGDEGTWDVVGTNHMGLNNGTSYAEGAVAHAFRFDQLDDFAGSEADGIGSLERFSIEFWVLLGVRNGRIQRMVTLGNEKAILRQWGINLDFVMRLGGVFETVSAPVAFDLGRFYHVAATYDGAVMRLYVDGVEVVAQPADGAIQTTDFVTLASPDEPLGGLLDEVTVYGRALTPAEIVAIFAAGGHGKCVPDR